MSDASRTPEAVEADIAAARDSLIANLGQLKAELAPKALVRRGGNAVKGAFIDEYGGVRVERVAIAVGVVAAVVGIRIWRRSRR